MVAEVIKTQIKMSGEVPVSLGLRNNSIETVNSKHSTLDMGLAQLTYNFRINFLRSTSMVSL